MTSILQNDALWCNAETSITVCCENSYYETDVLNLNVEIPLLVISVAYVYR
jgi:hypothetical protein